MRTTLFRSRLVPGVLVFAIAFAACGDKTPTVNSSDTTPPTALPACVSDAATRSCAGVDLRGTDLSGLDLSGWDMTRTDLRDATLTGTRLDQALLVETDLSGSYAANASLVGAQLFGATARGADWSGSDMTAAELEGADFRETVLRGADLTAARVVEVNFWRADLRTVDLSAALLARVYVDEAVFDGSVLVNAVVAATPLGLASTDDMTWEGAVLYQTDNLPDAAADNGALVCTDLSCTGSIAEPDVYENVAIPGEQLHASVVNVTRFGIYYGESPLVVSRNAALAATAALAVYTDELPFRDWDQTVPGVPAALRDAASLYAMNSAALALRRDARGQDYDGRLRAPELSRAGMLWLWTSDAPQQRASIVAAGTVAAAAAVRYGKSDGFDTRSLVYEQSGQWRPTPPAFAPALEPGWGSMRRYVASTDCASPPPDAERALEQAREVSSISAMLTEEQKLSARFWADDRLLTATPPGHWLFIAAKEAGRAVDAGRITAGQAVQVVSAVSLAMADALAQTFADKYTFNTARPLTLLEAEAPSWNSYLANPPFPSYPSGHSAVSRAAADVLTRYLGSYEFVDDGAVEAETAYLIFNLEPRRFDSFLDAAEDASWSRVWGGIHTMEDVIVGADVGSCAASLTLDAMASLDHSFLPPQPTPGD